MAASEIEWTDATWNPVTGCTRVSPGCDNCYAATLTRRLAAMGSDKYTGLINPGKKHFNGRVRMHPEALALPLETRRATTFFVNSMSDLFHKDVKESFIADVFGVMAQCSRHTFQVLTKRPERMAEVMPRVYETLAGRFGPEFGEPLANVWMGTSVEDQAAISRIDHLRDVPAAVRFLSCEPLLQELPGLDLRGIHWVIVGGESGPGARPMRGAWVSEIKEQCEEAKVAFFFKQTGAVLAKEWGGRRTKGGDMADWPEDLRVRQDPREFMKPEYELPVLAAA